MKRSLENSVESDPRISLMACYIWKSEIRSKFGRMRSFMVRLRSWSGHLIEAHDLLWDLKFTLIGIPENHSAKQQRKSEISAKEKRMK